MQLKIRSRKYYQMTFKYRLNKKRHINMYIKDEDKLNFKVLGILKNKKLEEIKKIDEEFNIQEEKSIRVNLNKEGDRKKILSLD